MLYWLTPTRASTRREIDESRWNWKIGVSANVEKTRNIFLFFFAEFFLRLKFVVLFRLFDTFFTALRSRVQVQILLALIYESIMFSPLHQWNRVERFIWLKFEIHSLSECQQSRNTHTFQLFMCSFAQSTIQSLFMHVPDDVGGWKLFTLMNKSRLHASSERITYYLFPSTLCVVYHILFSFSILYVLPTRTIILFSTSLFIINHQKHRVVEKGRV